MVTAKEARHRALRKVAVDALKSAPCMDCGIAYPPYVMDFDHRPGEVKMFHVGKMRVNGTRWEKVLAEIAKCDLVCSNCHRARTASRMGK